MSQPFGTSSDSKISEGIRPSEILLSLVGRIERFNWLPELDARRTSQPQEVHLLVKITIRHYKGGFIYLGELSRLNLTN